MDESELLSKVKVISKEEYDELTKSRLEYDKKRYEYDLLCKNNGEVVLECNYNFVIYPIYNVVAYKGKDDAIKYLSDRFNEQNESVKEMNEKWKLLLKLTDKKDSTFIDRLKFIFTGKLYKNESK